MIIGITGSFGCGKTTVAGMFARLGAYTIDADKVCHSLMQPSRKVYKRIVRHFGDAVLKKDRRIDRERLAEIVFSKRSKLKLLNSLIHPAAIRYIKKAAERIERRRLVVIDAALLIESGFYTYVDYLILVRARKEAQIDRLRKGLGMPREDILRRLRMQVPFKKKLVLADFIIDNSGFKSQTFLQVKKIWKLLSEVGYDN